MTKQQDQYQNTFLKIIFDTFQKIFTKHLNHPKKLHFDTLKLNKKRSEEIEKIYQKASKLVKRNINNVPGLVEFIEHRGTIVIQKKHVKILLKLINKEEGFIPPLSGIKCKFLLIGLKILGAWQEQIPNTSPAMFIFEKIPHIGFLVYHMHHWITFNKGLPGYSEKTQQNFAKVFDPAFGMTEISKMSKEEIIELREAIARDQEALDFLQRISENLLAPQSILEGIKNGHRKKI